MITIWDEVLFYIRVYFYGLVIRKKVFLDSIHLIETHLDLVVEVLELQSSAAFEFCLDEEFIDFFELISCLRLHMPPIFIEFSPSNGG